MKPEDTSIRKEIDAYCAKLGLNPLIVQGAGGNVSWKDGDTLWIKASGTWLAVADSEDIFLPVDLKSLRENLSREDYVTAPAVVGLQTLRPSIETFLHALMPQRVVVHLHAVDVLARLVRKNWRSEFEEVFNNEFRWAAVDYHRPGAELAQGVSRALTASACEVSVLFMGNHGLVIGGENISDVDALLHTILKKFAPVADPVLSSPVSEAITGEHGQDAPTGFLRLNDPLLHVLVTDETYFRRLQSDWALYPDHVVFLGPSAKVFLSMESFGHAISLNENIPELVFVRSNGIYVRGTFNTAKLAQLRCYYDVLARQDYFTELQALSEKQIFDLLNWDAEKYRMGLIR